MARNGTRLPTTKTFTGKVYDPTLDSRRIGIEPENGGWAIWLEDELAEYEGERVKVTLIVEPLPYPTAAESPRAEATDGRTHPFHSQLHSAR